MNRRFGFAWIWGLATVAIASIVGLIAYSAGHAATVVTTTNGEPVIYHGYYGFGFFPLFGLFWLFLFGFFFFRLLFWRPWGRGPWGYGGGYRRNGGLRQWHQEEHGNPAPSTDQASDKTSV
jgi:hypothetical protein